MIHAVIIDDELSGRETLQTLLQNSCPQVKVISVAHSAQEGIRAINSYQPELVFLDIEMPNGNGFDMLERIGDIQFEVIFVTAYDKYAIRAIKHSALDYLLKPILAEDLVYAVAKAELKIAEGIKNRTQYETLFSNLKGKGKNPVKIAIPDATGYSFVELKNVIRFESFMNNSNVVLDDGKKIFVNKSLKEFEEMLGEEFFRIHQSTIINLQHARKYIKGDGGFIKLSDGKECEVSRRRKEELLTRMSHV